MQNDVSMTTDGSKYKTEVEFQNGGRMFLKPEAVISQQRIEILYATFCSFALSAKLQPSIICNACLDMYVRQAIELRVLLLLLLLSGKL